MKRKIVHTHSLTYEHLSSNGTVHTYQYHLKVGEEKEIIFSGEPKNFNLAH